MTTGQRWKARRNYVIVLVHQHGASQRLLADVFDLPHSRIAAIVKEYRDRDRPLGARRGHQAPEADRPQAGPEVRPQNADRR